MREKLAAVVSFAVSAVLSFCCTLPLALASLGLGSLGLGGVLLPYRPWLLALGAISIVAGLVAVYAKRRSTSNKVLLWSAAAVFLVAAGTPYVVGWLRPAPEIHLAADERLVTLHLEVSLCPAGCDTRALEALDALPGVRRVYFDHAASEALLVVGPDAEVDDPSIERALRAADCKGRLKH